MPGENTAETLQVDCAIIGGGVAGLWLLNRLRAAGYSTVLLESDRLGSAQTAASQGIIHGGMKFALGGVFGDASKAVAPMPDAWRACLSGRGDIDLRDCRALSEHVYLLAGSGAGDRIAQVVASRLMRGRVAEACTDTLPAAVAALPPRGTVYRLDEPVLDVTSLVNALAEPHLSRIYSVDWTVSRLNSSSGVVSVELPGCTLAPRRLILAAGAGNEALLNSIGAPYPAMQRRPLQQVVLRHSIDAPLFAHFITTGNTPRLTVTSHRTAAGDCIWYLGGELATAGARESSADLIARAREELRQLMPGFSASLDDNGCDWATLTIDRAEARVDNGLRPDEFCLRAAANCHNLLVAWPTKLALCPRLGDAVIAAMAGAGVAPSPPAPDADLDVWLAPQGRPDVAAAPWEGLFQ